MSRDQKTKSETVERAVQLVRPTADPDDAAVVGDDELADIRALVRAAGAPEAIDPADNELLIALAIGTELDVSADERAQAEWLRDALAGEGDHPLADLAISLRAADSGGSELDELTGERLLRRALQLAGSSWRRRAWIAGAAAIAAGVALFLSTRSLIVDPSVSSAALIRTRSTQELFDPLQPFPAKGGESERADKIVKNRTADLRANRFAQWGAR